jgi:6-phosphogluconate dehydrogenase
MVTRLLRHGHQIVAYDRADAARAAVAQGGASAVDSLDALVAALAPPRSVWVMVPAGAPTESTIDELASKLAPGDVIIDGGNTRWTDDVRRAAALKPRGIHYVDAGTSGGIWGLENGYCMMVGGEPEVVGRLTPIFTALAPPDGFLHTGGVGSGHYVKMIHNGIEYAMMQAYAEGFELMHQSPYGLDLAKVATLWTNGSVVRSWLLELTARALAEDRDLAHLEGHVDDSGEGRWTLHEAIDRAVPMPATTAAVFTRFRSREDNPFADRLLAALRQQFGGHAVKASK